VIKKIVINALATSPILNIGNKLYRHKVPIFMMHRMAVSANGIRGHEPSLLRDCLSFLRKHDFNVVTIDDVAQAALTDKQLPAKSVAFTFDDGYADQVSIATDIFGEYDYPATFYITTGFASGDLWFWADKVNFIIDNCTEKQRTRLINLFPKLQLLLETGPHVSIEHLLIEELKSYEIKEINKTINAAAIAVGIKLPVQAPKKYQPSSWDDLRSIEKRGMMVGAHTYSHAVLSRESNETSKAEIEQSTNDAYRELQNPSKVFCYPVGRHQDYSQREIDYAKRIGYIGAVSSIPGAMDISNKERVFSMPRFGFPETKEDFIQYATWLESFKGQLRRT
jgi:peptidoglycan/xylan/chitin deacetylase (PgdA/CDA1 family)